MSTSKPNASSDQILGSLNDGVYAVNLEREIFYWSGSAERITGWSAEDVVGKHCHDAILCHIDKDGHPLCGQEHCPLHRAMVTDQSSTTPIIVFAQSKDGPRIPMRVSVAPIRDEAGEVIGGVETFRDLTAEFSDIQRAGRIQSLAIQDSLPEDVRISFATHYIPADIIGGDFYSIVQLEDDCYGFLLADVSGHGVPAALYTMMLSSLCEVHQDLMPVPAAFLEAVNRDLCHQIKEVGPFATAICGTIDLQHKLMRFVSAGGPPPLVCNADGKHTPAEAAGLPLGVLEEAMYDEQSENLEAGDSVLFFTDGAIEISRPDGEFLDVEGLVGILKMLGYPKATVGFKEIEERLLKSSDRIRFDDDITFIECRLR